jgi:hypothetical protein
MYDESYGAERKTDVAATNLYGIDTTWYTNTGAIYHITGDLKKLDVRNKYNGNDQVHTTSGSGRNISHSIISPPSCDLILRNILQVPQDVKNLLFIHRFTTNNHASLEYFPNFFLVKDLDTSITFLKGWCRQRLYPLPAKLMKRHAFGVVKPSLSR